MSNTSGNCPYCKKWVHRLQVHSCLDNERIITAEDLLKLLDAALGEMNKDKVIH